MDHRALLKKYMAHVTEIQGVDFITMGRTKSSIRMTEAEREELSCISEEVEVEAVVDRTGPGVTRSAPRAKPSDADSLPSTTWPGWRELMERDDK